MAKPDPSLADRIEAARERSATLASTTANRARTFVHDHPAATVAGGIVIGALIAGVLSRHRWRKAQPATAQVAATNATANRISRLATVAAELALAYAARAAGDRSSGPAPDDREAPADSAGQKLAGLTEIALNTVREAGQTALARFTRRDQG